MKKNLIVFLILAMLFSVFSQIPLVNAETPPDKAEPVTVYLPVITNRYSTVKSIVADHQHTDISQIPDYWIEQAKKYVVHYAHTSHGSQILSGLTWLEQQNPKYNVNIVASGTVTLPPDTSAMRFYDGNNAGTTYITPDLYWEGASGIAKTRSTLDSGYFDLSTWTWCGQMSYYSDAQIQEYIDVLAQLDTEYPDVQFIFYTGHTDGTTPESNSSLWRHNNMVRDYVNENDKILFDFADIESYDPDGTFYPYVDGESSCSWCQGWCDAHPGAFECQNLPSCAHTHGLQCTLKGQAFWYLMARFAGWDGTLTP